MEIKQLQAFVAVVRERSFSRAAESLYLSQSTVSAQIASLEKDLGAQLLVRTTKEVSLTDTGRKFYVHTCNILALCDQALETVDMHSQGACGTLHMIASTLPAQHLLPEIIAAFRRNWPNIVFHVHQTDSHQVLQEMAGFRYDFGFVGTAPNTPRLVPRPIFEDQLVLVLPGCEKANADVIQQDFAAFMQRYPIIMREYGSGTRTETENLFSKLGVDAQTLQIAAYFADTQSILQGVARGLGIALVSRISAALYIGAGLVTAVDFDSPLFAREIYLVHNRGLRLSPLQRAFADHAEQYFLS